MVVLAHLIADGSLCTPPGTAFHHSHKCPSVDIFKGEKAHLAPLRVFSVDELLAPLLWAYSSTVCHSGFSGMIEEVHAVYGLVQRKRLDPIVSLKAPTVA